MLLDTPKMYQIESNFISLFDRTFRKGIQGASGPDLKSSIKKQFSSKTFQIQIDNILNDICLYTVGYTDNELQGKTSASVQPSNHQVKVSASSEVLPLTEEAVRQSTELSGLVSESIIRTLKDEGIYQEAPATLAKRMVDLWGGEKYRADRFARTFSADVATSTALNRYKTNGIEEVQFYATIDGRTSPQCRALQGTVFKTESKEAGQFKPPLHHHCRSTLLPITLTMKVDPALRYENRDFGKPIGQDFTPLKDEIDKTVIKNVFKDIEKFKDKYAIDKFILEEDIEKRLLKLGVGVDVQVPKVLNTPNEIIRSYESKIKNRTTEKAYIFDTKGHILLEKSGTRDGVDFDASEMKLFKGSILTHNHPGGASFSSVDIKSACYTGVSEIRVTGATRTYIMKSTEGTELKYTLWKDKISKEYTKQNAAVKRAMTKKIKNGKLTPIDADALHQHEVWKRVSNNIPELKYSYIEDGA